MRRCTMGRVVAALALGLSAVIASTAAQTLPMPQPGPKKDASSTWAPGLRPTLIAAGAQDGATVGDESKQRALVDRVNTYLSNISTLVGDFVQVGPDGARTEGQFYIQKPGKVRFEYKPPSRIDVIADGQSVVVRDRKLATQDLYPLSQTPLRFLLSDHIDLQRDTNLVSVAADDVFVTLVVEDKQQFVGNNRLMLMFGAKDFQLRQWTVTDPQGYDTTVAVYNLDTKTKPDPDLFKINYDNPDLQNTR
ncbi:MAG: outer membrane lipoprotein carrier protein LolA [Xanthobacteraceae bacterium]|nr:outer membrane lipoprotein carrier protein LolA [Xanthobacteraceae bacterium]MBV9628421.1 outer membrane lipoprotein carrier protein LolA [Xanthobacteraceae bacterium]